MRRRPAVTARSEIRLQLGSFTGRVSGSDALRTYSADRLNLVGRNLEVRGRAWS